MKTNLLLAVTLFASSAFAATEYVKVPVGKYTCTSDRAYQSDRETGIIYATVDAVEAELVEARVERGAELLRRRARLRLILQAFSPCRRRDGHEASMLTVYL